MNNGNRYLEDLHTRLSFWDRKEPHTPRARFSSRSFSLRPSSSRTQKWYSLHWSWSTNFLSYRWFPQEWEAVTWAETIAQEEAAARAWVLGTHVNWEGQHYLFDEFCSWKLPVRYSHEVDTHRHFLDRIWRGIRVQKYTSLRAVGILLRPNFLRGFASWHR